MIDIDKVNQDARSRKRTKVEPAAPERELTPIEREAAKGTDSIIRPYPSIDEINKACRKGVKRPKQSARVVKFVNPQAKATYLKMKRNRNALALEKLSVG